MLISYLYKLQNDSTPVSAATSTVSLWHTRVLLQALCWGALDLLPRSGGEPAPSREREAGGFWCWPGEAGRRDSAGSDCGGRSHGGLASMCPDLQLQPPLQPTEPGTASPRVLTSDPPVSYQSPWTRSRYVPGPQPPGENRMSPPYMLAPKMGPQPEASLSERRPDGPATSSQESGVTRPCGVHLLPPHLEVTLSPPVAGSASSLLAAMPPALSPTSLWLTLAPQDRQGCLHMSGLLPVLLASPATSLPGRVLGLSLLNFLLLSQHPLSPLTPHSSSLSRWHPHGHCDLPPNGLHTSHALCLWHHPSTLSSFL